MKPGRGALRPELRRATVLEWQASLFGACFIAFGLGALVAEAARGHAPWIIGLGVVVHGWGMYRIHKRNR